MELHRQLSEEINKKKIIIISDAQLKIILDTFETIREEETYLSGKIRILRKNDQYFIQEMSNKNEILLRGIPSEKNADDFINQRLETYENMWNGCGCQVNYYE